MEFAYNNALHSTTSVSPFFTNKGYNPTIAIYLKCDLVSAQAKDYVTDLDKLHQALQQNIFNVQAHYQGLADLHSKSDRKSL